MLQWAWFLGVLLAVSSGVSSSLGQTLQRLSSLENEFAIDKQQPWLRKRWLVGTAIYMAAALFDAASYLFVPIAVVIVFSALRLPIVAVLARFILEVRISFACVCGIGLCAFGSALSLVFAPQRMSGSLSSSRDFFTAAISGYLCITFLAWAVLLYLLFNASTQLRMVLLPLMAAWVANVEKLFAAAIGRLDSSTSAFSWQWIWLPLLVASLMVSGGILNIYGVEEQSTHTFVPMTFAFQALVLGIESVVFGEFHAVGLGHLFGWTAGLVVAVAGVFLLSMFEESPARCPRSDLEGTAATRECQMISSED